MNWNRLPPFAVPEICKNAMITGSANKENANRLRVVTLKQYPACSPAPWLPLWAVHLLEPPPPAAETGIKVDMTFFSFPQYQLRPLMTCTSDRMLLTFL